MPCNKFHDLSGKGLSVVILNSMSDLVLDLQYLTGHGLAAMSGKFNDVLNYIFDKYSEVLYLYFSTYC